MLKLDSNGRIAHLLVNYTNNPEKYSRDLCGVIRGLLTAFFGICFIILITSATTTVLFGWIVPLLAYGFTWDVTREPAFIIPLIFFCIVTFIFTLEYISRKIKAALWQRKLKLYNQVYDETWVAPQPSIFAVWYDGFKNKYCPRVEFVDKDEER